MMISRYAGKWRERIVSDRNELIDEITKNSKKSDSPDTPDGIY
jgi:hypothetical protein